jgi:hypothetical protein
VFAVVDILREMDLGRILLLETLGVAALAAVLYLILCFVAAGRRGEKGRRG